MRLCQHFATKKRAEMERQRPVGYHQGHKGHQDSDDKSSGEYESSSSENGGILDFDLDHAIDREIIKATTENIVELITTENPVIEVQLKAIFKFQN